MRIKFGKFWELSHFYFFLRIVIDDYNVESTNFPIEMNDMCALYMLYLLNYGGKERCYKYKQ